MFACEPEWEALVKRLGGQHVNTFSATTAFQDPHYVEARPSLIAKTRQADLLICTGAELEIGWLPLLLRKSRNANIQTDKPGYFLAADQVKKIEIPSKLDRSQGDVHASGNPHVHWDPYRLLKISKELTQRLIAIDPQNEGDYKIKLKYFELIWTSHIKKWESLTNQLIDKKVIVHHKNWSYLLNWLGIKSVGDLEPKPGLPPTSSHLVKLLKTVRSDNVDYILNANYQDSKGAEWLSNKSKVPVINLPFTVGGNENVKDMISLYDEVITRLIKSNQ